MKKNFLLQFLMGQINILTGLIGSHGVMVSTLDFESSDPSSNLGGTWQDSFSFSKIARNKLSFRYLIFQYFDFFHGVGNFIDTACPSPVLLQLYVHSNFLSKFHHVKRIGSHGVLVSTSSFLCNSTRSEEKNLS